MSSEAIYRVAFSGGDFLSEPALQALRAVGAEWDGSGGNSRTGEFRHCAQVRTSTSDDAIGLVQHALEPHGAFRDFAASQVSYIGRDGRQRPFQWPDRGIDWSFVRSEPELTQLQKTLLENILNAAEPTWIILQDKTIKDDRQAVENALRDLEARNLVFSSWELAAQGHGHPDMDHWWAVTDTGWELLGLIKPPGYH
jgi:hypothetical protein